MNANGQVSFNPTTIGGGNIAVGGRVGLMNLESYDQFMPAWYNDAKASMNAAEANGQRAANSPDGTMTSSFSSSSSLMDLKTRFPATFKRSGGKVYATFTDENGKRQTITIPERQLTQGRPRLMNLADSHMGNFDSFGDVVFQGGGDGMHTIDNMRGNAGSTTTFSI